MEAHNWFKDGFMHCYTFGDWEKKVIAESLKPQIKKIEKKIEKIENHPDNEGQADYAYEIRLLRGEIRSIKAIIKEFSQ